LQAAAYALQVLKRMGVNVTKQCSNLGRGVHDLDQGFRSFACGCCLSAASYGDLSLKHVTRQSSVAENLTRGRSTGRQTENEKFLLTFCRPKHWCILGNSTV